MALDIRKRTILPVALILLLSVGAWAAASDQPESLLGPGVSYQVPFKDGEQLGYEVNWKPLFLIPAIKAGDLHFSIKEADYKDTPVYRIQAEAVSNGTLPSIAGIDVRDYFESIIDRESFRSYRMLQKTREGKRKRDLEMNFDYDRDQVRVKEEDVGVKPSKKIKDKVFKGLSEPATDIVSVFYVGRLRILRPGDRLYVFLNDEGEVKRIGIEVGDVEKVTTPIGTFDAMRIDTKGKIFKSGGNLRVWYTNDELRIPVKFEADVKFGKVYGALTSMQTKQMSRSRIRSQ